MVKATATPQPLGFVDSDGTIRARAPIENGRSSDTGLTTTAPAPAGALTAQGFGLYCYVS